MIEFPFTIAKRDLFTTRRQMSDQLPSHSCVLFLQSLLNARVRTNSGFVNLCWNSFYYNDIYHKYVIIQRRTKWGHGRVKIWKEKHGSVRWHKVIMKRKKSQVLVLPRVWQGPSPIRSAFEGQREVCRKQDLRRPSGLGGWPTSTQRQNNKKERERERDERESSVNSGKGEETGSCIEWALCIQDGDPFLFPRGNFINFKAQKESRQALVTEQ